MTSGVGVTAHEGVEIVPTAANCAEVANHEHGLVLEAGRSMLDHAIRAGDALLQARVQCDDGGWLDWLNANFAGGVPTAQSYMRIANYADIVKAAGIDTITDARAYLRGLSGPHEAQRGRHKKFSEEIVAEARRLRESGVVYAEIGRLLGVSPSTVRAWCDPSLGEKWRRQVTEHQRRRRARLKEEREREHEKEVRRAARRAGHAIAEAYALAERMQDVIGRAHSEASDHEARAALSRAGEHYRKMRDEVVRALGVA